MTSFNLNDFYKGSVSKYTRIGGYSLNIWILGHNSVQNTMADWEIKIVEDQIWKQGNQLEDSLPYFRQELIAARRDNSSKESGSSYRFSIEYR